MATPLSHLNIGVPIVDSQGRPATFFQTLMQAYNKRVTASYTARDASYLTLGANDELPNERTLVAGGGLALADGGAGGNATLTIQTTGVTAGSYGSASRTIVATVNDRGQITVMSEPIIAIGAAQISDSTATGRSLVTAASAAAARTAISAAAAVHTHPTSEITGLGALASRDTIDDGYWSGTPLAVTRGGTGSTSASDARTALGLGTAAVTSYTTGTWTPSITGSTSGTATAASAGATYTKIGRLVFVQGTIRLSNAAGPVGFVQISGLPFVHNATNERAPAGIAVADNLTGYTPQTLAGTYVSDDEIRLADGSGNLIAVAALTNTTRLDFSATYETAS